MSDQHSIDVHMRGGIVATIWRNKDGGKYRCCVTFTDNTQISTTDFRFRTIAHAHTWAQEIVAFVAERSVTA